MPTNTAHTETQMGSDRKYCYFCSQNDPDAKVLARYDFKTIQGPWAYACTIHWIFYRAATDENRLLGLGIGQKLTYDFDKASSEERG